MSPVGTENWRDSDIGLRGDPDDIARVTTAAAAAGVAPSRWAGDALAAALEDATGWTDGTRRHSPRKPNRQPRKDRQGDRHLSRLAIRVSGEEKRRITDLATGKGTTITEWAWSAITEALEKGNWHD